MTKVAVKQFVITKTFAEDGRRPEVEHYTEDDFQKLPIEPWLKECARHSDFDHITLAYYTHCTTIQRGEDLEWEV